MPPANDDWANRETITGDSGTVSGSNVGATSEGSEPVASEGSVGGASVWWTWTAPQTGSYAFDTIGSKYQPPDEAFDLNTVLSIFTGASLATLVEVAADDDGGSAFGTSRLLLPATASTTYSIRVDGWDPTTFDQGSIVLNWQLTPALVEVVDRLPDVSTYDYGPGWFICPLSSAKSLCLYVDDGDRAGYARVVEHAGDTLSMGSEVKITDTHPVMDHFTNPNMAEQASILGAARISDSKALVIWRDTGGGRRAVILSISGSTIAAGTIDALTNGIDTCYIPTVLSDGLAVWPDGFDVVVVCRWSGTTISGDAVSNGPYTGVNNADPRAMHRLSDTTFLHAFSGGPGGVGESTDRFCVATVNGDDTITWGTDDSGGPTNLAPINADQPAPVWPLTDGRYYVAWTAQPATGGGGVSGYFVTVSGTTVTVDAQFVQLDVALLSSDNAQSAVLPTDDRAIMVNGTYAGVVDIDPGGDTLTFPTQGDLDLSITEHSRTLISLGSGRALLADRTTGEVILLRVNRGGWTVGYIGFS